MIVKANKVCPEHGNTEFKLSRIQLDKSSTNNGWWCCCQCWDKTDWNEDAWRHQVWFLMNKFKHIV